MLKCSTNHFSIPHILAVTFFKVTALFFFSDKIKMRAKGHYAQEEINLDRKQYFEELHIALTREGFTSQPEQDELLPVEWDGLPLCRITADGAFATGRRM